LPCQGRGEPPSIAQFFAIFLTCILHLLTAHP
jgi:hypothetical protein